MGIAGQPAAFSRRLPLALIAIASLLLAGCAGGPPLREFPQLLPVGLPDEIAGVPFHPQEELQCGPAALATALGWSGVEVSPDELEKYLFLPERQGTLQPELKAQARRQGRIPYQIPPEPAALLQELAAGHPVLVLQNNGLGWWPVWHYAVAVGMDPSGDTVRLRSGTIEDYDLARDTFLRTWHRAEYWALAVMPPERLPASVTAAETLSAISAFSRLAPATAVVQALELAVDRWPSNAGLRFALGNAWYAQGEHGEAEAMYRAALVAAPGASMVRNNLAWLLGEQGRVEEAQVMLAETELEEDDPWAATLAETRAFLQCRSTGASTSECASNE